MRALVAVLLAATVMAAAGQQLDRTAASCSAYSFLQIRVTEGTCSGNSRADCDAVATSLSDYAMAFQEWWVPPEERVPEEEWTFDEEGVVEDYGPVSLPRVCDVSFAQASATAIAQAIAQVWTNAAVKVTCDGVGFACGYAIGNGQAWAIAFAEAIAIAAADVSKGSVDAFCFADIQALSSAFADAASKSLADVCTEGGTAEDFASDYASAVVNATATAFATATASACSEIFTTQVTATSQCDGQASSFTKAEIEGEATGGQVPECAGGKAECCTDDFINNQFCPCEECNGPLRSVSNVDEIANAKKAWKDVNQENCACF